MQKARRYHKNRGNEPKSLPNLNEIFSQIQVVLALIMECAENRPLIDEVFRLQELLTEAKSKIGIVHGENPIDRHASLVSILDAMESNSLEEMDSDNGFSKEIHEFSTYIECMHSIILG